MKLLKLDLSHLKTNRVICLIFRHLFKCIFSLQMPGDVMCEESITVAAHFVFIIFLIIFTLLTFRTHWLVYDLELNRWFLKMRCFMNG